MSISGVKRPDGRTDLEQRNLAAATIRRKLASIFSLFDFSVSSNDRLLMQTAEWLQIFRLAQQLRTPWCSSHAIMMLINVQLFFMFKIYEQ